MWEAEDILAKGWRRHKWDDILPLAAIQWKRDHKRTCGVRV